MQFRVPATADLITCIAGTPRLAGSHLAESMPHGELLATSQTTLDHSNT